MCFAYLLIFAGGAECQCKRVKATAVKQILARTTTTAAKQNTMHHPLPPQTIHTRKQTRNHLNLNMRQHTLPIPRMSAMPRRTIPHLQNLRRKLPPQQSRNLRQTLLKCRHSALLP